MKSTSAAPESLIAAGMLADAGMPVFSCGLDRRGNPMPPEGWQETVVGDSGVRGWKRGRALCGVTGVIYDVLDVDPRNGGAKSFAALFDELGDDLPDVDWKVRTPSGGIHMYIAPLGIGTVPGFMPGLDLKGGKPDGSSRGFVFLPPTVRPSKDTRRSGRFAYAYDDLPCDDAGFSSVLRDVILAHAEERTLLRGANGSGHVNGRGSGSVVSAGVSAGVSGGVSGGRADVSALRSAAVSAEAGGQRAALLKLVHEYERKGYDRSDIVTLLLGLGLRSFDEKRPWNAAAFRGLLHAEGEVVADGVPGELDGITRPVAPGLVRRFSEVEQQRTSWIWPGYLARGEMTIMDGEKGVAKSLITLDIAARLSTGRPLPGWEGNGEKVSAIVFCLESNVGKEIAPRLSAALADMDLVWCRGVAEVRHGRGKGSSASSEWVLPESAAKFGDAIKASGASVAIFDPINDFLSGDVNPNSDASIRQALGPLGRVLDELDCAGWLIRHMNKDTGASARMRGTGTTAYQNRARVHLVVGRIPPSAGIDDARYGLACVDSNLRRIEEGVLAYDVVDSDIVADDSGGLVPMLEWHGRCNLDADALVRSSVQKGPPPIIQEEIREVLESMFKRGPSWPVKKVMSELALAKCSTNPKTVAKVAAGMGLNKKRHMRRGASGGVEAWYWTTETVGGGKFRVMEHSGSDSAEDENA
jgi:hypothetical protein